MSRMLYKAGPLGYNDVDALAGIDRVQPARRSPSVCGWMYFCGNLGCEIQTVRLALAEGGRLWTSPRSMIKRATSGTGTG